MLLLVCMTLKAVSYHVFPVIQQLPWYNTGCHPWYLSLCLVVFGSLVSSLSACDFMKAISIEYQVYETAHDRALSANT